MIVSDMISYLDVLSIVMYCLGHCCTFRKITEKQSEDASVATLTE